jgi:putative PEP-CTERM system integral membrane protein
MKTILHVAFHGIFWLWNLTFLLVVYVGILPFIGIPLAQATFAGEIEREFLITLVGLIAVPTICTLIGWMQFRKRPLELMRLFYGVEAPFFLLCIVRLFVLRELTPASNLIVGTVIICIFAFVVELLWGYLGKENDLYLRFYRSRIAIILLPWAQLAAHSLMLFVGLYVGVLLLFYAVPAASVLLAAFFSFRWLEAFWWQLTHYFWSALWTIPTFTILFAVSASLFLAMPSGLAALYVHSGQRILRAFAAQNGGNKTAQISLGVVAIWMLLFMVLQQQPQIQAFKLLENPPKTDNQRQELLAKSEDIRQGLVNGYLSSYRYLGTWEESNQIHGMYRDVFKLPEPILQGLQNSYNQLISPFLYQGDRTDDQKAEKLYAQFFDTPLQKGEREAVQRALKSTAILDDAKAGLLNINQKKVWLKKQAVTIKEQGNWADVEIYEVYNNQTFDVEEIFYSFSLPESATIAGIWLGDTDKLSSRFPFTVSPRGAAQKVYNSQVRRERPVDPALLEQVGSRHYRLRAFPIPPKLGTWERNNSNNRPTEMHLWLTYKVMRSENGWQLPKLGEKRNIFWTKDTQRIRNGKAIQGFEKDWLEASLPASSQSSSWHQVDINGYRITAKPLSDRDYVLPQGKRFAVILDTSRSMGNQKQELAKTFDWLKQKVLANNQAELYVTAAGGGEPEFIEDIRKFNLSKKTFYGTLQIKEMLRQFVQLQGNKTYDDILLVTDEGSYELSDNSKDVPKMSAPLWLVHLGSLPPAYDDATLKAIQDSGGGVSTSLPEVLQRLATTAAFAKQIQPPVQPVANAETKEKVEIKPTVVSVVDGYAWYLEKATDAATTSPGFEPFAARMLVQGLSKQIDGKQLGQLDGIHAIAKTYKIVTPYSSMIVLVNDEQREALKKAEAAADRFDRKVENGKERLNKPNNPLNTSIPEPGMAIGLSAIALFLAANRKRYNRC